MRSVDGEALDFMENDNRRYKELRMVMVEGMPCPQSSEREHSRYVSDIDIKLEVEKLREVTESNLSEVILKRPSGMDRIFRFSRLFIMFILLTMTSVFLRGNMSWQQHYCDDEEDPGAKMSRMRSHQRWASWQYDERPQQQAADQGYEQDDSYAHRGSYSSQDWGSYWRKPQQEAPQRTYQSSRSHYDRNKQEPWYNRPHDKKYKKDYKDTSRVSEPYHCRDYQERQSPSQHEKPAKWRSTAERDASRPIHEIEIQKFFW